MKLYTEMRDLGWEKVVKFHCHNKRRINRGWYTGFGPHISEDCFVVLQTEWKPKKGRVVNEETLPRGCTCKEIFLKQLFMKEVSQACAVVTKWQVEEWGPVRAHYCLWMRKRQVKSGGGESSFRRVDEDMRKTEVRDLIVQGPVSVE